MDFMKRLGLRLVDLDWTRQGKWFLLSGVIGIVAGLGAIAFQLLTQLVFCYVLADISGFSPGEPDGEHAFFHREPAAISPWLLVAVAGGGGLVSGWLVYTFAPEAEGHGTDAAIESFHCKRGEVRPLVPFIKTLASAITIGTGGSGGREGPIAQIGAGFGSFLATRLGLSARDRRIMLAAGMGAGVGAIFRAPLAGALFAAEIFYSESDLESDVVVPAALSSIVAYTVYTLSIPSHLRYTPLFGNKLHHTFESPWELIPYIVLSIVLTIVAVLYIKVFYGVHKLFARLPVKRHFRPAIGATLAALVGVGLWQAFQYDNRVLAVMATGYRTLQIALDSAASIGIPLLVTIALAKILTTSLTISSGGSGGVFGPSMVIGGCTGAAVGQGFKMLWPDVVTQPEAFALVGMAGFFAGAANAPISTIIMVSEMTGDYSLLMPTMFCSTLCFIMCRKWKLYVKQVPSRLESPAHRGDFNVDLLEGIKVKEAYRPLDARTMLIPESMSLSDIVHRLSTTHQHYFPVVNEKNDMVGIFSSDDVRSYLYNEEIWALAVANDIMVTNVIKLTPDDDLNTALTRFTSRNLDELPVVDKDNKGRLLGMLRRKETIGLYNRRLVAHKSEVDEAND
ncbi:MAG: chloride channel protein [Planctomycetales bacterium]|nr:chloride channel protein [Planctomycetales bacterium]